METIAYLKSSIRNGTRVTYFVPVDGIGMQEILEHDTAAVLALRRAAEENQRLRQKVSMLEKLVRAENRAIRGSMQEV